MNKMYKPIGFIAAVTAMSLVSCQKQELRPSTEGTTITVNATVEDAANLTKTSIEEVDGVYNINWDENEVMQAVVWNESKNNDVASSAFSKEADGTGIFSVTIPAGEWTNIAGIYPSESSSKASGDSQSRWRINLPTAQTPAAGSYDPKAYVLIARPATLPSDLTGYEYNAFYYRATALNRFRINNLEHGGNIVSARITFPEGQKVSGHKRVDLTTTTVTSYNANNLNYVDLNYAAAPLAATDSNYDLWFTTWGVSVSAEETVTVEITTEDYKYTKSFTGNTAEFKENCLNLLALNMTGAEAEELTPADDYSGEYLIVTTDGSTNWAYMSDYESSRFAGTLSSASASRDFATLTKDDFAGADDYIWTVSKVANGYTLYNAAKRYYLNLNSNSTTANTSDTAITLDVILNDDGTYQISYPGSTRSLRGNYVDRAWRFANYVTTGSQKDIYLLPWVESTEPALIVSEASKTVAAEATEVVFEYIARNLTGDVTATIASDESQIISGQPVVNAGASTVTVTLNPNTDEVEKTATITLSADGVEPVTLTITQRAKPAAGTKYYVKVTEEPADWSGQYLIVYEDASYAFDGSLSKLDAVNDYKKVTIDGAMIESTSETDAISFTISSIDGGYAIQSRSGYYIYNSSDDNALKTSTEETGVNTISLEDGSCKIVSSSSVLRFNSAKDQMRFRYYKSSSYTRQKPIQLYKLQ